MGKGQLDLRTPGLAEGTEEAAERERRAIFHHRRVGCAAKFLCLAEGVFDLAKPIDELVITRVASRKNATVGNRVAEGIRREVSLFPDDAEKLLICAHCKALHVF